MPWRCLPTSQGMQGFLLRFQIHCPERRGILGISKGFACVPAFLLPSISHVKEEVQP